MILSKTIKPAAFALAIMAGGPAAADRVSILIGSHHAGAAAQFEQSNPGLFYTWEAAAVDYSLGIYRNSYGRTSIAATASLPIATWNGGQAAIFGGLAHYPQDGRRQALHMGKDVVPIGGLQIRHGNAFLQFTPMDGKPVKALFAFGLTFETQKSK